MKTIFCTFCLSILMFVAFACSSAGAAEGVSKPVPEADPAMYGQTKANVESRRIAMAAKWKAATDETSKTAVLNQAGPLWRTSILNEIIPHWYGTDWDFNGITRQPNEGSIACGYFITTVLEDAGLKLERARLAQQASSEIIKKLCASGTYEWISNKSRAQFLEYIKSKAEGLYLVGLDNHIGFLHHTPSADFMIHASYLDPGTVVKEKASESEVLNVSKVFVIGRISPHRELVIAWLEGKQI